MHVSDDTSKIDLNGIECEDLDWFQVALDKAHWAGSYEYANERLDTV